MNQNGIGTPAGFCTPEETGQRLGVAVKTLYGYHTHPDKAPIGWDLKPIKFGRSLFYPEQGVKAEEARRTELVRRRAARRSRRHRPEADTAA